MKSYGIILICLGVLWLLFAFNMATSVSTKAQNFGGISIPSMSVNNLEKMDEGRNHLMLLSLFIIVGAILLIGGRTNNEISVNTNKKHLNVHFVQN